MAIDALLAGERPRTDPELRPPLAMAERLRTTLTPVLPGVRFQAALAERIHGGGTLRAVTGTTRGRLIAAGAFSSAAVGVGVTAYAVWRTTHRPGHR